MRPIPIGAAAWIARFYGYPQVVIVARAVGESGGEHVTTFGIDPPNCDVAARIGDFFKRKLMGWPDVSSGITCTGCAGEVSGAWTWCPWCGAQGRTHSAPATAEAAGGRPTEVPVTPRSARCQKEGNQN